MSYIVSYLAFPFIYTMGHEKYRDIVLQEFDELILKQYFEDIACGIDDTTYINRVTNDKFVFNENGTYQITHGKRDDIDFIFPTPKNLEEFICDCFRCSVLLCWKESFMEVNRSMFMDRNEIQSYTEELLKKIDKQ